LKDYARCRVAPTEDYLNPDNASSKRLAPRGYCQAWQICRKAVRFA
jgi:hypothetical protein